MPNLDAMIQQIWPKIRARHFYPELPAPKISEGRDRVALELKGKQISLSSVFVSDMSQYLEPRLVLEGLLDHAISHYIYCPWDFSTHLELYQEANAVIQDTNMAKMVADMFMDVVANTHCVSRIKTPLPDIYRSIHKDQLLEAECALYQKIWGLELGVEKFEDMADRLSRIPYLDRRRWPNSIRRFATLIQELLEQDETAGETSNSRHMGDHALNRYSPQEIEDGLKNLAAGAATPVEFKAILKDIQEELSDALGKTGLKIGFGKGDRLDADILYYMKLAHNYSLPIRKRLMEKSGCLYPHHHVPWEAGQPFNDIDPWKSFGKIMPGLTKSWHRVEGEMYGREYGTPDCIVIIDSSGSMIEPRKNISYAVLGAACAAEAYLRNEAHVAVYNFSDASAGNEHLLSFTRNRRNIYDALCRYFGGGTQLYIESIQAFQTKRLPDIFLITDMQITNLDHLVQYFIACKNRITAVLIGKNKHINAFRQSMVLHQHIQIYEVENLQDIPGIVLGRIREFLHVA